MSLHQTIHKFIVPPTPEPTIMMPKGAIILHVAPQDGRLCIWAQVVTRENGKDTEMVERHFRLYGTGHDLPVAAGIHRGTAIMVDGKLVLHLFEV